MQSTSYVSLTHLLDVADGQLEFLARMPLEHITSTGTLTLGAAGCIVWRKTFEWPFAGGVNTHTLTCQTDLVEVDAIGHQHQAADALGPGLFGGEIAERLFVLGGAAK